MIDQLKIKEAIKNHGTSINEVAEKMGISRFTLSSHVNGNPSTEILLRIADAIGCPVTDLFEQPKKGSLSITCPHCGKDISIKIE
ncbi:XRE family transcriptional regulator [Parabacteroides sp. AF48-14]|uniref:helix-turn-helix transcriptional regulator n=1 Tax=Parabacteroides sp. AF48-14 TaxID=2292052 RepID=UPI000F010029|nr:helix-turn-helix transcriptional regulator [Parabacteroides sp. AF48-14]RHO68231.1 XRE family transcriptional regulator [Parabacteroides sp. AF48-14]